MHLYCVPVTRATHTCTLTHELREDILCLGCGVVHLCQVNWILESPRRHTWGCVYEVVWGQTSHFCWTFWEESRADWMKWGESKTVRGAPASIFLCSMPAPTTTLSYLDGPIMILHSHARINPSLLKSLLLNVLSHPEKQLVQVGEICFYNWLF